MGSELPTSPVVAAGAVLAGKYKLEALIGQGGMGTVWSATHLGLGKQVAVKLITSDLARHAEIRKRFDTESARLRRAVRSPGRTGWRRAEVGRALCGRLLQHRGLQAGRAREHRVSSDDDAATRANLLRVRGRDVRRPMNKQASPPKRSVATKVAAAACAGIAGLLLLALTLCVAPACDDTPRRIYSAQLYEQAKDCLDDYTPLDIVKGGTRRSGCDPVCLAGGGATYVSTVCPPYTTAVAPAPWMIPRASRRSPPTGRASGA